MASTPFMLIAEDDRDDQFMLQTIFKEKGDNTPLIFVYDGVELISFLNHRSLNDKYYPGLILIDLNMPKMDGREALQIIKTNDFYKGIPTVMFSTINSEKEIKKCYECGADGYIIKPANYNDYCKTVRILQRFWRNRFEPDGYKG